MGTEENCVHQFLMCKLGRADEDDRDHFGKKYFDLAGPLLGGLFRVLSSKFTKDVRRHSQRCLDDGRHFNVGAAIKSNHITDRLKYLATGNCKYYGSDCLKGLAQMNSTEMEWIGTQPFFLLLFTDCKPLLLVHSSLLKKGVTNELLLQKPVYRRYSIASPMHHYCCILGVVTHHSLVQDNR